MFWLIVCAKQLYMSYMINITGIHSSGFLIWKYNFVRKLRSTRHGLDLKFEYTTEI